MRVVTAFLATALLVGTVPRPATAADSASLSPIIAQLLAEPEAFNGKLITVYGLVIQSRSSGKKFVLQDVSQRPLQVVGGKKLKAADGDQVTVIGTFHRGRRSPYVTARVLIPTRVLGGGGCC